MFFAIFAVSYNANLRFAALIGILRGRVSVTKTQIQNLAQMKEEAPFFENVESFISFLKSSKKNKVKEGQDLLTQEGKSIVEEFGSLLSLIPDSISKTDKQTLKKNLLALIKKML
ncbi:hypothetical protein [Hugenholtzia roseola]|uniref:hypothetical protein n=1 Tax=Hugenholtzia roseola TaxID=1002 RepID=UPI00047CC6AF|nr:hypothetical protein [Hugenholtzia roseola]